MFGRRKKLLHWLTFSYFKNSIDSQRESQFPRRSGTGIDSINTPSYLALEIFDNLALASSGLLAFISKPTSPRCAGS